MENEKRLIDANALSKSIKDGSGTELQKFFADVCVATAPTVDAVEVTRCENCTRGDPIDYPSGYVWCTKMCRYMKLDGFCSFGG